MKDYGSKPWRLLDLGNMHSGCFAVRRIALLQNSEISVIQQRTSAEAAINEVNETIDGMTRKPFCNENYRGIGGDMAVEQRHINHIFIYLRRRDFWDLNHESGSRCWVARDIGTYISCAIFWTRNSPSLSSPQRTKIFQNLSKSRGQ